MVGKGSKKGTVRFALRPDFQPRRVQLLGDFTDWIPVTMRKQKDGSFVCVVPLQQGTYEYKFLVDGQWHTDPDNHCWSPNRYGTMNSVAQVD